MEAWVVVAVGLLLGVGLVGIVMRTRRQQRRRLEESVHSVEINPVLDLVGAVIKGSLGLVSGLLKPDQLGGMVADDGTVTLLFSDIEDSTRLNVAVGDTEWARIIEVHDAVTGRLVSGAGGRVVKRQGDGLMAALPSAEAGLTAALALREGLRDHAEIGRHLDLRIGVHTGEVVGRDGDYFGANVAMAARIADAAQGDQILLSEQAQARLVHSAGQLSGLRPRRLKGLPGRHRLFQVRL